MTAAKLLFIFHQLFRQELNIFVIEENVGNGEVARALVYVHDRVFALCPFAQNARASYARLLPRSRWDFRL